MGDHAGDVGLFARADLRCLAARRVDGKQRPGVAVAAVAQVHGLAVRGHPRRSRGEHVVGADLEPWGEGAVARQLLDDGTARRRLPEAVAEVQVPVGESARPAVVLQHQLALAAGEIEPVDVVVLRDAVVETDQDRARHLRARADHAHRHLLRIGVRNLLARCKLDAVEHPVLVAAAVLRVEDAGAVGRPPVLHDRPGPLVGDRLRLVERIRGRDPDVQHAVARREPGDGLAVGRELRHQPAGVAEDELARDQVRQLRGRLRDGRRGECRRGSERDGGRGGQ